MHLQDHFALQSFGLHPSIDSYHSHFDDVGGRALDGGVDGISFSKTAHGGVMGMNIRQIATAMEHCFGIAFLADNLFGALHVIVHLRESLEETVNQLAGLTAVNLQTLSQTEDGDAVDDTEIGTLRLRALIATDLADILFIDGGGGGGVQIFSLAEHFYHVFILREMGHYTEFNL